MVERVHILLIEDNPADADLAVDMMLACAHSNSIEPQIATDGVVAMSLLRDTATGLPDLIMLDLNLPRKDGRQFLAEMKQDDAFKHIPVVVMTSSEDERDIYQSYALGASCYIAKPKDLKTLRSVFRALNDFWFSVAKLPSVGRVGLA